MTLHVTVRLPGREAAEYDFAAALRHALDQVERKAPNLRARAAGCVCTHPESDDLVYDANGNRAGTIRLEGANP